MIDPRKPVLTAQIAASIERLIADLREGIPPTIANPNDLAALDYIEALLRENIEALEGKDPEDA